MTHIKSVTLRTRSIMRMKKCREARRYGNANWPNSSAKSRLRIFVLHLGFEMTRPYLAGSNRNIDAQLCILTLE